MATDGCALWAYHKIHIKSFALYRLNDEKTTSILRYEYIRYRWVKHKLYYVYTTMYAAELTVVSKSKIETIMSYKK